MHSRHGFVSEFVLVCFASALAVLFDCTGVHAQPSPSQAATAQQMIEQGYVPLFNGTDLGGWRNPYDHGKAKVVDGEIHLIGDKKFFLVTDKTYSDFRVSAEIQLPTGPANSGLMFRCHVEPNKVYGYQAECDGSDRRWSAGLYDEGRRGWVWPSTKGRSEPEFLEYEAESKAHFARPEIHNALNRDGWNRFVIECRGDRITIELNGVKVTELRDETDAEGYIGIQHHGEQGQTYKFRNLFIKKLPHVPAESSVGLVEQAPKDISWPNSDVAVVDFGRVAFGNLRLLPPEGAAGVITVHFGEKLNGKRIDRKPPGTVRYNNVKVKLDGSEEVVVAPPAEARNIEQVHDNHPPAVLTPRDWGVVLPFRWVEIQGWPGQLKPEQIIRRAAFSKSWDDDAASFESSDPMLNQIWDLCRYSIKATTFAGVYVDGDRERIPYEADAYLNQLSHYTTDNDVEMAKRTFDWLMEYGTWPSEWAPHMIFMAHSHWMQTGDAQWLAPRYESLKAKTLLDRTGPDGLVRSDAQQRKRTDIVDWPKGERDEYVFSEINTVVNSFHLAAMQRMSEMARAIGKEDESIEFEERAKQAQMEFQRQLFNPKTGLYRDGVGTDHSSHHANFFPLALGLVPDENRKGIVDWLRTRDMDCSVYAAQYLLEGLFQNGGDVKALQLITAANDRSWRHMVESGTTITWEAWDMKYKPNQDWNHAWGAAPANLLPRFVLGAQPLEAGWKRALISPFPSGLKSANGKVPTPRGPITIDWKSGPTFRISVGLPEGMTAKVELPAAPESNSVFVDGKQVAAERVGNRWMLAEAINASTTIEVK